MSQVLLPNDLRLAGEAYDKALGSLPPEAFELQPYAVRRTRFVEWWRYT